jgi:hypothetical protein
MSNTNDITGDKLISKISNETYRSNYDRILWKGTKTYSNGVAVEIALPEEWLTKEEANERKDSNS